MNDGFLKYGRNLPREESVEERIRHFHEFVKPQSKQEQLEQASRCMDCGIPFCHEGCPLGNKIPEFNAAVQQDDWGNAFKILRSTNNFPEFTGRICPAPCEKSCVLSIGHDPVTIEQIEKNISDKAWELGYYEPNPPAHRSGKKIAVVGSGPAGLAAADQLNQAGHEVVVFEQDQHVGGLLRYGIPDFKLEKDHVARRVELMKKEGIEFKTGVQVGKHVSLKSLRVQFDAVLLAVGSTVPRDLKIPGRELKGIHFAMDFLKLQNENVSEGSKIPLEFNAAGREVIVIGGGDTGSDCLGTSIRQGAGSVRQLELLPKPPVQRNEANPWPEWPRILFTSSSQKEGGERMWAIMTREFVADESGRVKGLTVCDLKWSGREFEEVPGSERFLPGNMILLAMGFTGPEWSSEDELGFTSQGLVRSEGYATNLSGVFVAGDARRGQSLVVWAIHEGREAAVEINEFLGGEVPLPSSTKSLYNL